MRPAPAGNRMGRHGKSVGTLVVRGRVDGSRSLVAKEPEGAMTRHVVIPRLGLLFSWVLCGCSADSLEKEALLQVGELQRTRLASFEDPEGPLLSRPRAMIVWRDSLVDLENASVTVLRNDGEAEFHGLPDPIMEEVERRFKAIQATVPAGTARFRRINFASASDQGVLLWMLGKGDPAGVLLTFDGDWVEVRGVESREEFPKYPTNVLYWGQELYVLSGEGIRVYSVTPTSRSE
jgi:hypothetical protein